MLEDKLSRSGAFMGNPAAIFTINLFNFSLARSEVVLYDINAETDAEQVVRLGVEALVLDFGLQ